MSMDDLPARKKAVRDRILQIRTTMDAREHAARSTAICAAIRAVAVYAGARGILFYMPFRGEADISPLFHEALREERTCAWPRCSDGHSLRLFAVTDPASDFEQGRFGIPEPKEGLRECTLQEISVILVPGAAFDRQGGRIGYGAGYYDRLLAGSKALKIAPVFAFQVLPELPHGGHDIPVDIIVTEEETIDCQRAGEE